MSFGKVMPKASFDNISVYIKARFVLIEGWQRQIMKKFYNCHIFTMEFENDPIFTSNLLPRHVHQDFFKYTYNGVEKKSQVEFARSDGTNI